MIFALSRECSDCAGNGYKLCKVCEGHGEIKWFIELTVVWTNHVDDFILNASAMPDKKIRKGVGMMAFEEERPRVFPVNHCPEASVNEASSALVNKHQTHFKKERILLQRHRVRIVPVTEVGALWKEKAFQFCVYGLEHRVYTKDYPQRCCSCGCLLL